MSQDLQQRIDQFSDENRILHRSKRTSCAWYDHIRVWRNGAIAGVIVGAAIGGTFVYTHYEQTAEVVVSAKKAWAKTCEIFEGMRSNANNQGDKDHTGNYHERSEETQGKIGGK